ncbi:MAG: hypothetical protein IJB55_01385 [Firmicutes bacterium]|nr:hypothetical protein [Bacillota bacterium]
MSSLKTFFGEAANNSFLEELTILPMCLDIALVICAVNLLCFLYRVLKGPALSDRAVAMDSCGITVMALIVIYSIRQGTTLYMSCALVIAILGFIGMVTISKYLQSGNVVDNSNIILDLDAAQDIDADELQARAEAAKQKNAANQIATTHRQRHHHKKKKR